MNRDQIRAVLPILQAFAEGKTVQFRPSDDEDWCDCVELAFGPLLRSPHCYRIKPEPREWFLLKMQEGVWHEVQKGHFQKDQVHVREVLD